MITSPFFIRTINEFIEVYFVTSNKNHDIEVLRTIAIVFVFLAHIPSILAPDSFYWKIFNISRFGSGVDLFFCVSGFIVTKSLIQKNLHLLSFAEFRKEAKFFYIKRAWRLFPAAFFWIVISTIFYGAVSAYYGNFNIIATLKPALFSLFQVQNIFYMTCRDEGACGALGIYWSLSLENQFYLLLPLFLFALNNKRLFVAMIIVFLIQFFIPRTLNNVTPIGWPIRTDAIALGVIVALITTKPIFKLLNPVFLGNKVLSFLFILITCFLLAILTNPNPIVFYQVGLTALISGLMVHAASYNLNYYARNNLIIAICDYIGSRSYSLYLTHVLALLITRGLFMRGGDISSLSHTVLRISFFLTLTILMTEFSYKFIENKFRYRWGKNKTTRIRTA